MFLFGIGTSPALISIIIFKNKLNFTFRKYLKSTSYYFSLMMAVLLIMRGMNLGIPYLSPHIKVHSESKKEVMRCCIKK
jgi:sulfite exporter TauE/SafE